MKDTVAVKAENSSEPVTSGFQEILLLDVWQVLRARWFWGYSLLFAGLIVVLFTMGVTESQIIGFIGLSRLMVTFIQICIAVIPIFVLITTVRSVVGERETLVLEYMLSLPVSFKEYFWGKFVGRFLVVFFPVFVSLLGAVVWGTFKRLDIPWDLFSLYSFLLAAMIIYFLGLGMFLSTVVRSQEMGLSVGFVVWILMVAFLDIILLGLMLKTRIDPGIVIGTAMLNPLQVFRTAAMALFDPKLTVLGPASYYILDTISRGGFIAYAILYPVITGLFWAWLGYWFFSRTDSI